MNGFKKLLMHSLVPICQRLTCCGLVTVTQVNMFGGATDRSKLKGSIWLDKSDNINTGTNV